MPDITEYLRKLSIAKARSGHQRWSEAAPLWELVVEANPVNGNHWSRLAEARFGLGDFAGALVAYQKVTELGTWHASAPEVVFPAEVAYRIARCHARLGDADRALRELQAAVELGYRDLERAARDEHFESLRDSARFRALFGPSDVDGLSRDEGWRADLRYLGREIKRRAYRSTESVDERVDRLVHEVPELTDAQVLVEIAALLRTLGDGHARVFAPDDREDLLLALPLEFYVFEDGLFVTATAAGDDRLLGAQVLAFDGQPTERVMAAVDRIVARDNEHGVCAVAPWWLVRTPVLHALGLTREPSVVVLSVRLLADGTTVDVEVPARPAPASIAQPVPAPPDWRVLPESRPGPLPLYLRNSGVNYWFSHQSAERLTYFQFNSVADDPDEPLKAFTERLFGSLAAADCDRLVMDLRWNGGGNTFLTLPLLHRLIGCERINRPGGLFVVIGRRTFSAAQNFTTMVSNHTHALFVGEPTGSRPNFVGETIPFRLPYSRFQVNVSDLYWQTSWPMDHRTWIAPDLYAPPTFASYVENRDPAMEAILACRDHLPGW
jgi:tetratricopeptide (TPR) repeat protein